MLHRAVLLNLFLVAEPFSKIQLFCGTPNLILHKMFNIIFPAKNKRISVKNEFFSKIVSLLEIIPIVTVLS